MNPDDPIEALRGLWLRAGPGPSGGALEDEPADVREAVEGLRQAWGRLRPPARTRRAAPRSPLVWAAAAAILVAVALGGARRLDRPVAGPTAEAVPPAPTAPAGDAVVVSSYPDRIVLRTSSVTLVLVR